MAEIRGVKKGQVTIFIILGIVIVGGIVAYFLLRDNFFGESVPEELRPAYDYYVSCLNSHVEDGVRLLGDQGGRIDIGEFSPGSSYMPFSSHLDFLGQAVPYWMYVSGNNLLKENVPTKSGMEEELEKYVRERVDFCDFTEFERQGFDVYVSSPSDKGVGVDVKINEMDVEVEVNSVINIFKGESSAVVRSHDFTLKSKLGKFFDMAKEVYDYEKENMFLEYYALDVMRLYAPVTGVDQGCEPLIFNEEEISGEIKDALVANIGSIRLDGSYYDLSSKEREYFVHDSGLDVDENLNFMYMRDWTTRIEMYGDKVVKPVGLQEGLGALGFCYTPYHFTYDIDFPVMVQFFDEEELFQFPLGVVISKSQAREALPTASGVSIESKVCEFSNQEVRVLTSDVDYNPVEARISFKCLDSVCDIGSSELKGEYAVLDGGFPQCVNGFIVADAPGYATAKYQISTNVDNYADIILKKKYKMDIDLGDLSRAIVSFESEDFSAVLLYPETNEIELIEGYYNISVYVYSDSGIQIPATSREECVDSPESGLAGILGQETQKCFTIDTPAMDASFAVVGGGKTREYITREDLKRFSEVNINVPLFDMPKTVNDLSANYDRVEDEYLEVYYE